MDSFGSLCGDLVTGYPDRPDRSVRRLLVTVFGDSIEPHGGTVWLGSLIRLVAPLGVSERLVRTSVHRLVAEGVLASHPAGRRSFYNVADGARADFRQAERRIYHRPARGWDGRWTFVLATGDGSPEAGAHRGTPPHPGAHRGTPPHPGAHRGTPPHPRADLRRRLGWIGFGAVMPGVFAHPTAPLQAAVEVIAELKMGDEVAVLRADSVAGADDARLARLASNIDEVAGAYGRFLARWSPLVAAPAGPVEPQPALLARTLLIDDYRRVLLRDPELPAALLPPRWAGDTAHDVSSLLYERLDGPAETHLGALGEGPDGALPPRAAPYRNRFGGERG